MDSANLDSGLLEALVRLTDKVPDLRIVVDHLPIDEPADNAARGALENLLRELAKRPQVYIKVSNVPRLVNGRVPEDLEHYRPALDQLWDIFGADRLIYGSNWPVSNLIAPYPVGLKIVREYFATKGQDATEKYFHLNATKAYALT
jgi:predicted TIM-barrel fold metal-dependent hydrolase